MAKKNDELDTEVMETMPDPEEYVSFTAPPPINEGDDDLFLSVNGENVRVRRGETVKIKRKFVEVWEHAEEQRRAALEARRRAKDLAGKPIYM